MEFAELNEALCPLLAKHYVETYNAPPWNDRWTEALALERLGEMMDCRGAFGLVGYDDRGQFAGAVVGSAETFFNGRQFFVKEFFVSLTLQGQGIGSLLLAELEKRLATRGIAEIYLMTSKGERTEGFYQRRGFQTWDSMVLMGKSV
jgi:GNAT superfamily N-acetyltransferase